MHYLWNRLIDAGISQGDLQQPDACAPGKPLKSSPINYLNWKNIFHAVNEVYSLYEGRPGCLVERSH